MIVAIANQKGGVGKTTLAVHLAAYVAQRDGRVVLVDGDPQGNATSWLLGGRTEPGMRKLLVGDSSVEDVVRMGKWDVALIPGDDSTGDAMTMLAAVAKLKRISEKLAPIGKKADHLFIDMPPSRSAGFRQLLAVADALIVPTQLERLSLEGVRFMARTVNEINDGPRLLGIVPNMVRRTNEHKEQLNALADAFPESIWPPIPLSVRVPEACGYGTTMFDHAPKHKVTRALLIMAEKYITVTGGLNGRA
jgi:chromosome partitioning protein